MTRTASSEFCAATNAKQANKLQFAFTLLTLLTILTIIFISTFMLNETVTTLKFYHRRASEFRDEYEFQRKLFWNHAEEELYYSDYRKTKDYNDGMGLLAHSTVQDTSLFSHKGQLRKRLPDAIIIGVSKTGTRALLDYLSLHPDIAIAKQEVNFFNNDTRYNLGFQWYKEQMPLSYSDQMTIEKSPDYFNCKECPVRIHAMNKTVKLLVLLRNPVERLISQYMQFVDKYANTDKKMLPFDQWVRDPKTGKINTRIPSVKVSIYADFLKEWFKNIPRQLFIIIDSSKFTKSPVQELVKVENFLGLKPYLSEDDIFFNYTRGFHCMRNRFTGKTSCLGPTKGRQHIEVDKNTLQELYDFYNPHNQRLAALIGHWLTWS